MYIRDSQHCSDGQGALSPNYHWRINLNAEGWEHGSWTLHDLLRRIDNHIRDPGLGRLERQLCWRQRIHTPNTSPVRAQSRSPDHHPGLKRGNSNMKVDCIQRHTDNDLRDSYISGKRFHRDRFKHSPDSIKNPGNLSSHWRVIPYAFWRWHSLRWSDSATKCTDHDIWNSGIGRKRPGHHRREDLPMAF